ncbi:MAG: polyprenyl synthetase family protein [Planctomycetota bacterium]
MTLRSGPMRLAELLAPVRAELDRVSRELVLDLKPDEVDLVPLVELAASFRGKQLRPALVLLAGRSCGGLREEHVAVAKIVELLHTATLVHDDVLDGASLRRQQKTVNAVYGTEVPVLLGDYIYARAFHMAVQLEDPTCSRVLAETTRRICQGEITQILHRFDFAWDEARYYRVIVDKTATLYAAACRLGAHYAGGNDKQIEAADRFGLELGTAFQIVDDCLDLDGEESVVGKSLGTDLLRGKLTLPLLWIQRQPRFGDRLRGFMESAREMPGSFDTGQMLRELRKSFPLDAALQYAMDAARARLANARKALTELPPSPAREGMEGLVEYVLDRSN